MECVLFALYVLYICVIYVCYAFYLIVICMGLKKKQISFQKEQIQREERRSEAAINYQSNNIET